MRERDPHRLPRTPGEPARPRARYPADETVATIVRFRGRGRPGSPDAASLRTVAASSAQLVVRCSYRSAQSTTKPSLSVVSTPLVESKSTSLLPHGSATTTHFPRPSVRGKGPFSSGMCFRRTRIRRKEVWHPAWPCGRPRRTASCVTCPRRRGHVRGRHGDADDAMAPGVATPSGGRPGMPS